MATYNGIFYSVDGYRAFDRAGQPIPPEDRSPDNWLLTSNDAIAWERTLLPDEMRGLILSIDSGDDGLKIWGTSAPGEDPNLWTSLDGATWTAQPNVIGLRSTGSNPLDLTVPGIAVEGLDMQIDTEDPVSVGEVQLVQGRAWFIFPQELYTFFRRSYSVTEEEASNARGGSIEFLDVSTERVLFGISYAAQGTSVEYAAWDGAVGNTDVIHTARIDLGSDTLVERLIESGPISPQLGLLWRSTSRGEPFSIVDEPFESFRLLEPDSRSHAFDTLLVRDGRFVAYGTVSGGPTTTINENVTRNEPSTIAAIATSSDGLAWTVTEIPELVNPWNVETLADGRVVWSEEFGFWISDDGLTGEFIALGEGSSGVESAFGALIAYADNGFRISEDRRRWSRIAFPQQVANGTTGFSIEGDRAF